MARKKVTLQLIANQVTRRATYKKRVKGLIKKVSELSTLCNIKACVVVYGEGEAQPEIWPSTAEAMPIIARFRAMPELSQYKKMMNQEDFLRQRVTKLQEQLHKAERETRDLETTLHLSDAILGRRPGLTGLTVEELVRLSLLVEVRLNQVKERIAEVGEKPIMGQPQKLLAPPPLLSLFPVSCSSSNIDLNLKAPKEECGKPNMVKSSEELGVLPYTGFTNGNGASTSTKDVMTHLPNTGKDF